MEDTELLQSPQDKERKREDAYRFAISLTRDNASELARRLGVTPQAVVQWRHKGIPPRPAMKIAVLFNVPVSKLVPELFGGI